MFGYNDTGMILTREYLQQIAIEAAGGHVEHKNDFSAVDCSIFVQSPSGHGQGKKGE